MPVPSIETKIEMALLNRVSSLPMIATYPIVWSTGPGTYAPSPTQPYLRCTWTPNSTQRRTTGSREPSGRPGVLQIDVMDTKTRGSIVAKEAAGQVALHFPADHVMRFHDTRVKVSKAPSVLGPFIGTTHVQVPIEIEVEAYE